jgi:hypothetical protein
MDDHQRQSAFMSALTTEHYVLQAAASATSSEAASRTSIYMLSLSSALIALGFASHAPDAFGPLAATVLPAVVVLGVLTLFRMVDITLEYRQYLVGIAHIRGYYRTLTAEAAEYFAPARGRWPEPDAPTPPLQLGVRIAFLTTASAMIAVINSIVAGAAVTLLARALLAGAPIVAAIAIGGAAALLLLLCSLRYQRWRFVLLDRVTPPA